MFDKASKTPEQNNEEADYDNQAQPEQPVLPAEAQNQPDQVMNMLFMRPQRTAEDFDRRRTQMRKNFPSGASKIQLGHYVMFTPKLPRRPSILNQLSSSGECHIK